MMNLTKTTASKQVVKSVIVDAEGWVALQHIALDEGVSASALVRGIISDYLAGREQGDAAE